MACSLGCGKRADALKGLMQRQAAEQAQRTAAEQAARAARRVGVVSQHAARDLSRVMRSALPIRRPK